VQPSSYLTSGATIALAIVFSACANTPGTPTAPEASSSAASAVAQSAPPWGPETPHFNLQIILRGEGFGLVKFRQPNDDALIVFLDTWVRDLAPNTSYFFSGRWTSTSTTTARAQPGSLSARDFSRSPSRRTRTARGGNSCFGVWPLSPSARSLTSTSESSTRRARQSC
jgi:hypothetical protein